MSSEIDMSTTETPAQTLLARPKRADARRNYEKVLAAAREAFAEGGESTSLEEIARRAGVGIGTLYRHFPNRQALLEALYVDEVEEICRSAAELDGADPWEALNGWFERFIALHRHQAGARRRAAQLPRPRTPRSSRPAAASLFAAGEPLLEARPGGRRRAPGRRPSARSSRWSIGIAQDPRRAIPTQTEHILRIALDGLRYRPRRLTPAARARGRRCHLSPEPARALRALVRSAPPRSDIGLGPGSTAGPGAGALVVSGESASPGRRSPPIVRRPSHRGGSGAR